MTDRARRRAALRRPDPPIVDGPGNWEPKALATGLVRALALIVLVVAAWRALAGRAGPTRADTAGTRPTAAHVTRG